jgi:hypothetical protein
MEAAKRVSPLHLLAVTLELFLVVACNAHDGASQDLPPGCPPEAGVPPACTIPQGVSTTPSNDGCYAVPVLWAGEYGSRPQPDGNVLPAPGCVDLCAPGEYGMFCAGSSQPPTACTVPEGGAGFGNGAAEFCCPCAN